MQAQREHEQRRKDITLGLSSHCTVLPHRNDNVSKFKLTYLLGLTAPFNYRRLHKYNSPS